MFFDHFDKPGAILRPFPKLQLAGSAANHLFARISGYAKETFVHVDVAALWNRSDGDRFRIRVERLTKCLFRIPSLGDIHESFFVYRGRAALALDEVCAA